MALELAMRRSLLRQVRLSSSSSSSWDSHLPSHQRVWTPLDSSKEPQYWTKSIQSKDQDSINNLIGRIELQERKGGRMQQRQLGVLSEDPVEDMRLLIQNYTVPSLASALRDREDVLQHCAELASQQKWEELAATLEPFEHKYVLQRRSASRGRLDVSETLDDESLEKIRKVLMRMPRRVTQAHQKRAGVVLPLCNVDGIPCLLLEKRATKLRAHPDEVCLPGGMICTKSDQSIVATCLREMREEIGGISQHIQVLGVLRCNWGEVHHLVGVAVTPLVCFLGEIGEQELRPNQEEVAECFTLPLESFLDKKAWIYREGYAPIFTGGPHVIWGLTGYICQRFAKDVLTTQ